MGSGKGKRKQTCKIEKGNGDDDEYKGTNQRQQVTSEQHDRYDGDYQHQTQLSENDVNDEEGDGGEHSDGIASQRSWSPVIKSRRRFSARETQFLESEYAQDINPSSDKLEMMATTIGTTRRIITTWFQNHRAKGKRNNTNAVINKNKKSKRGTSALASKTKSKARTNITQPTTIGSTTGSCLCINQATAVDDSHHAIFSTNSAISDHPSLSGTTSPLDMNDASTLNAYNYSYADPVTNMMVTPITTINTWNDGLHPTLSTSLSSSPSFATEPHTTHLNVHRSTAATHSYHYFNTPYAPFLTHSALPQCCVDELYTGFPCPFHSFYI
ncbi:hypothetical protein BCR42DRAFT_441128 [Absidia repens]|uniref:Homeobox domain-containing protein n=1 Tax=Absidia repens TaxID=90262 RepID=A0A1X2I707_9FUNG|nr:hypothetical protein BCR42DRAFT_441128 [Absidia repens]